MSSTDLLERSLSTDPEVWPVFSWSQLQAWDRCEKLWDYSYARNWYKVRKQFAMNLGTEIHLSFKNWYDLAIDRVPKPERLELVKGYYAERINEFSQDGADAETLPVIARSMFLTMLYFQDFAPINDKGHKILATEHHFTVPFKTGKGRNFILQGYIDLLTEKDGVLWVWDHKSMELNFWTPVEVEMEPQTPTYCAALREQGQNPHGVIINMVNTYDYKKPDEVPIEKVFRREKAYKTDAELDTYVREMKFMVDDVIDNYETPRRSLRRDCKSCGFQEPCHMSKKGINDEPFLRSDYMQKTKVDIELKLTPERLIKSA